MQPFGTAVSPVSGLTFGGLVLRAVTVVAAQAGVQRAAEALVVQDGERVKADTRLMVELATVRNVATAHRPIGALALKARVEAWWWRKEMGLESLDQVRAGQKKSGEKNKKEKKGNRNICALTTDALLTLQLLFRLEGLAQTLQMEHPIALTLTRHQLLTCLLTHLQPGQKW